MILYNVTVGIDEDVEGEWLQWMIEDHIPEVMATQMFLSFNMYKILSQEEGSSPSYSIQYQSESIEKMDLYLKEFAPELMQKHMDKYKNQHVAFRTLLEKIV